MSDMFGAKGDDGEDAFYNPFTDPELGEPFPEEEFIKDPLAAIKNLVPPDGAMVSDLIYHYQFDTPLPYKPGDFFTKSPSGAQLLLVDQAGNVKGVTTFKLSSTVLPTA